MNRDKEDLIKVFVSVGLCFLWLFIFGWFLIFTKRAGWDYSNYFVSGFILLIAVGSIFLFIFIFNYVFNELDYRFTKRYLENHAKKVSSRHKKSG